MRCGGKGRFGDGARLSSKRILICTEQRLTRLPCYVCPRNARDRRLHVYTSWLGIWPESAVHCRRGATGIKPGRFVLLGSRGWCIMSLEPYELYPDRWGLVLQRL